MPTPPTARDAAADLLLTEEKKRVWIRDGLAAARAHVADARDRALVTELAYGVVRRKGTLDAVLASQSRRPLPRLSGPVRVGLRLALYQMLFLDRVPVHAAVDHAVTWVRRRTGAKSAGYANAVLRATARQVEGLARGAEDVRRDVPREDGSAMRLVQPVFADPEQDEVANLSARYAMPAWLVSRWIATLGLERAKAALRVGIGRPPLTLRAREDRDVLASTLAAEGLDVRPGATASALLVVKGREAEALSSVSAGTAWVQDMTAQRVAPLLRPVAGQRLLDLCAAPGGKALHLADLLGASGEIVAADVDAAGLEKLAAIRTHVREGVRLDLVEIGREGPLPFEAASFDGILVDAPCTNTGVLRRRVEARWRLSLEDVSALAAIQRDLLERAVGLLKPGGCLVYSTCSLEPEENAELVRTFLTAHPEFELEEELEVPPSQDADGGYAARMRISPDPNSPGFQPT